MYLQFFLGSGYYLKAFCQDFGLMIQNVNELRDEYVKKKSAARDRIQYERALKKELSNAVDFQGDILE